MSHLTKVQSAVLSLLSYIVGTPQDSEEQLKSLSSEQWMQLYDCVASHGLSGLCFDVLEGQGWLDVMPRRLKIDWHGQLAMAKEPTMRRKRAIGEELAEALAQKGIPMVILKGLSFATFYDNPLRREFGDIDCYLMGRKQEGEELMKSMGAVLEEAGYKHSHLYYKGLMIENHKYLTSFNNTSRGRHTEQYLQSLINQGPNLPIGDSKMLKPSDEFCALFMLKHSLMHFQERGVGLRELLDWAHFIKKVKDIDWRSLVQCIEELGLLSYACVLTSLCRDHLLMDNLPSELLSQVESQRAKMGKARFAKFCDAVLQDLFMGKRGVPDNEGFFSKWSRKFLKMCRMYRFRYVYDNGFFTLLFAHIKYGYLGYESVELK